jgi:hypothetical protein
LSDRAGPGAEPRHLLLPPMPAFKLRASDIEAASGGICPSHQGFFISNKLKAY